jgi:hypothetical protein
MLEDEVLNEEEEEEGIGGFSDERRMEDNAQEMKATLRCVGMSR